ncbi:sensor histidine kinase [Sphingomonas montana]|uniref:sensor histidine kinase n=1 Tax=Sphingomonas montana TaxID=1843236 RepID=UPI00096DD7C8|nr:histidine kinase [Sphingomonas montana]
MPAPSPSPIADDPAPPVGTAAAIGSIVAFWAFYCAVATLRAALLNFDGQYDLLLRRLVVTAVSMAISAAMWRALRRVTRHGPARAVAIVALLSVPAALAYAIVNQRMFLPAVGTLQVGDDGAAAKAIGTIAAHADVAVNGYFFFAAWAALYLALAYAAQGRVAERRAARFAAAAQSAELRALRYQVNPHFLFNTLNSLSALVMTGKPDEAERMILNLSTFFRSSLAGDPATDAPLADEIALQRLYLAIETVRFPARILLIEDIADPVADALVPGLILQPLVENAVKHGVSRSRGLVTIAIRAWAQDDMLALSVTDDAPADPRPDDVAPSTTGIGLRNVADRLAARFGARALCRAGPSPGGGFAVTILMPLVREE